jgi:hypothetical protein
MRTGYLRSPSMYFLRSASVLMGNPCPCSTIPIYTPRSLPSCRAWSIESVLLRWTWKSVTENAGLGGAASPAIGAG